MNVALPRFLKSVYRREPLPSFLLTVGLVDAVIGGLDDSWSLLTFGLLTAGAAIALRWWLQQQRPEPPQSAPQRYLPPGSSSQALPMLTTSKKNPPR